MKKTVLYFIVTIFCASAMGQKINKNAITGSWLNVKIVDLYEPKNGHGCDISSFDNHDKLRPLYLSFINPNKVIIKFRVEGGKEIWNVNYSNPDSIFISLGKIIYRISVLKGVLQLRDKDHLIIYKKVSDGYSKDVFGEYVKDIIFSEHKSYAISFFKESNKYSNSIVNRENFTHKIGELFKSDAVEFVKLGAMKYGNTCLPEIVLYFEPEKAYNMRVFGILKDKGNIGFIDRSSGVNILSLKPN
jgi:hypothetical protein